MSGWKLFSSLGKSNFLASKESKSNMLFHLRMPRKPNPTKLEASLFSKQSLTWLMDQEKSQCATPKLIKKKLRYTRIIKYIHLRFTLGSELKKKRPTLNPF